VAHLAGGPRCYGVGADTWWRLVTGTKLNASPWIGCIGDTSNSAFSRSIMWDLKSGTRSRRQPGVRRLSRATIRQDRGRGAYRRIPGTGGHPHDPKEFVRGAEAVAQRIAEATDRSPETIPPASRTVAVLAKLTRKKTPARLAGWSRLSARDAADPDPGRACRY